MAMAMAGGRSQVNAGPLYDAAVTDRRAQLVHQLESPRASFDERVAIADRLGELGDPRAEEWVEVPAGVFVMGTGSRP